MHDTIQTRSSFPSLTLCVLARCRSPGAGIGPRDARTMAAKKRRRKKNRARRGRSKPRRKRTPSPAVAAKASTEPVGQGESSEPDRASAPASSELATDGRPRDTNPEAVRDGGSGASPVPVADGRHETSPEVVADDRGGDAGFGPVADGRPSEAAPAVERPGPTPAPRRRADRAAPAAEPHVPPPPPPAIARERPRHGFFRGAVFGVGVVVPVLAATLYILRQLGVAAGRESLFGCLRYALMFASVPAVITWGGIARALVRRMRAGERSGVRAGVATSAAGSAAGAGLIFLVAIPAGALSAHVTDYVWVAAGGAGAGLLCGVAVSVWIVRPSRRARAEEAAAAPPSPTSISEIADIADMTEQRGGLPL